MSDFDLADWLRYVSVVLNLTNCMWLVVRLDIYWSAYSAEVRSLKGVLAIYTLAMSLGAVKSLKTTPDPDSVVPFVLVDLAGLLLFITLWINRGHPSGTEAHQGPRWP